MFARYFLMGMILIASSYIHLFAQEFPDLYNSEPDKTAQPMPPDQAAKTMQVPEGFHVGVFACEPAVQNPIAMNWDARGRLWIAENFTYAERTQRFDLSLRDRVLVFEDADGDGKADKRTVFTDQVQMLTSVEVGHGGVWLMCPPQLLFIPDANHDDIPDQPATVLLDGFVVAKENYHNFANGLRFGPDGWLYGRCGGSCPGRVGIPGTPDDQRVALEGGIWRFHPRTQAFEVLAHGTTNPWGHDWDEFGECFFINTVNGHLWHMIPGSHLDRPFTLDPNPQTYELIQMHADHWHFDTTGDWTKSRDGGANAFGGGHAHEGVSIYLGDNWPAEYRGRLLTLNFHGRRANQELLERKGSGYVGRHGPDMMMSADAFFRGMDLSYGPDGTLYVLDWSDTGECHEHTGVHRSSGRIFRVHYGEQQKLAPFDLRALSDQELVGLMKHPNEWYVRQARLLLSERFHPAAGVDELKIRTILSELKALVADPNPLYAFRGLATLAAMDRVEKTLLNEVMLTHPNEHLRTWSIRLLTDRWPIDDIFGPHHGSRAAEKRVAVESEGLLDRFCALAKREDSGLVRLTLASTIQRLPVKHRSQLAAALMTRVEDAEDHNLPLLVWYGLIPVGHGDLAIGDPSHTESANGLAADELSADGQTVRDQQLSLAQVAIESKWPKTQRLIARRLAERIEADPHQVNNLLIAAAASEQPARLNLLRGIADGLKGWRRAPKPADWDELASSILKDGDEETQSVVRDLSVLFGNGRALEEVRQVVLDEEAEIGLRLSALQSLVNSEDPGIVEICLPLLGDARLNNIAAKGLARSSDPLVAKKLIENYHRFRGPIRPQVISILVSRVGFAGALLDSIENKRISASDLTAFDVRQIHSLGDKALSQRVTSIWGEVRESTAEKQELIASLRQFLTADRLTEASLGNGRILFNTHCAKCHRLYGQGETIGPELTGSNRNNLDYLLDNIVDPSAVVSKDFGMTIVQMVDGRVLNGLVATKNEKTLTLQTQTDLLTIPLDNIENMKQTTLSPMADGTLATLSETEIRDLIGYLMHPTQVELPPSANAIKER
jgi:putative membrane-bound dehydrogenase-like protein